MYQSHSSHSADGGEPACRTPYGEGSVYVSAPSPRRRRKIAIAVVGALAASVLTAFAVDRVAAGRAESRTAEAFQDGMNTPTRPDVHVRGFPVLAQLASGTLQHVDITAQDIPADGSNRPLPVARLTVGLDDLQTSGDAEEAHARAVNATAFLSYEDVSNALGLEISQDGEPGRVRAVIVLPLAGEVAVSAGIEAASGNSIRFTDFRVVQGQLPGPGRALLDRIFAEPIPLENIPEGLHLRSVTPTADGIDAHFTGRTVTFCPGSSSSA
ncbi:DUF2993 domain-containing protein [Streptomyces massasporeus]|uniref:LmeA family phospholipid-binding protein n=1 Tax=Streptomyces iakyrus TaxID=68219 RepID=UPI0036B984AF